MNLDKFIRNMPIVANLAEKTDGNLWVGHLLTAAVLATVISLWLAVAYFYWFDGMPPVAI